MHNSEVNKEKQILWISFIAGLMFAIVEFIYAIYSHSQSVLMDASYDSSELIFIGLTVFLTPLFHQPISEKRPYGFYQVESIALVIKGFMLLAVTVSISASVIQSALSGGNMVDGLGVSLFQLILGTISLFVFLMMKKKNKSLSSPTVDAEIFGWKLDVAYSMGLALAFFGSTLLQKTKLAFLAPYFDQIVALGIVAFMLPQNLKMLSGAIKDIFLFSPDEETLEKVKEICRNHLTGSKFQPVFYDVTRTGRRLWISVYFQVEQNYMSVRELQQTTEELNAALDRHFENCTCELIPAPASELEVLVAPEEE